MMSNSCVPRRVAVAGRDAAGDELVALLGDDLADLLAHRLAQVVRLGERVAGDLLRHPHHRLLVDHQAVGVAEDLLEVRVQVLDRLAAVLAVGVVVVHVRRHRPGPVERDEGGDVVEAGRLQRPHEGAHRAALELEHADPRAALQELQRGVVVERDGVDVEVGVAVGVQHLDGVGDDVEVAQAEEVHLQQAELLDAVHLELRDDRRHLGRLAGLGLALHRQVLGERFLGDHDGGGVDAVGALQALEALGDVDDLLDVGVGVVHRPQLGRRLVAVGVLRDLLEAVLERGVAAHHERRHRLGDLVADGVREAEHPRRVAHRVAGLDRAERDDLGDVVAAVALGGVADHLVPVAGVEVHVDVGHRDAARVEEALEQQVVADRVEVGDPQRVGDGAPGGRAAAGTDADARRRGRA